MDAAGDVVAGPRCYWVFHANPVRSRVLHELREGHREVRRCVTQHAADISVGDGVVLWLSGAAAGVYAIGEVAVGPTVDVGEELVGGPRRRVPMSCLLRWDQLRPSDPISKAQLLAVGGFGAARIIRQPMGGNPLRLTEGEWQVVTALR